MRHQSLRATAAALVMAASAAGFTGTAVAQDTITIGLPGIPPVFVNTQAFVAEQEGLFEKYGVNVELRAFDSGAAAARAVAAGEIELSMSPSPLVVTMVSNNPDVGLVAIYGYEYPDWLIGSVDDSITECEQVRGQPVGVDSLGGARSIALNVMLRQCDLAADDTQQVPLSANVLTAMISGQIPLGVLHIDDVPIIEREAGREVITVVDINDVATVNHYLALVTNQSTLEARRDDLVRVIAAYIEAERFIRDEANWDEVAQHAEPTGRSVEDAKWAIERYVELNFWPQDHHGLNRENVEAVINTQKRVGNIQGDPVAYDNVIDLSLYEEALQLVEQQQ
jgi:NitT/TauT family transport system substrate-binding protein